MRRVIGRDSYSSKHAYGTLNRVYYLLRLYINFFQSAMKLVSKTRHGAKAYRVYDTAQTPYRRVIEIRRDQPDKQSADKRNLRSRQPRKPVKANQ